MQLLDSAGRHTGWCSVHVGGPAQARTCSLGREGTTSPRSPGLEKKQPPRDIAKSYIYKNSAVTQPASDFCQKRAVRDTALPNLALPCHSYRNLSCRLISLSHIHASKGAACPLPRLGADTPLMLKYPAEGHPAEARPRPNLLAFLSASVGSPPLPSLNPKE